MLDPPRTKTIKPYSEMKKTLCAGIGFIFKFVWTRAVESESRSRSRKDFQP